MLKIRSEIHSTGAANCDDKTKSDIAELNKGVRQKTDKLAADSNLFNYPAPVNNQIRVSATRQQVLDMQRVNIQQNELQSIYAEKRLSVYEKDGNLSQQDLEKIRSSSL